MKNYLLTIFGSVEDEKRWAAMTPEQMQVELKSYLDFNQKLVDNGMHIAGEGLSMKGAVLKEANGTIQVTDGPHIFAKELVGGFWLIKDASLEEAAEISKGCPALKHGSTVEVREQMEY